MSLEDAFADGPAFIPYLAAGDPDYESSLEYVEALERGGADIIELGLPFSEPVAEGPTIQNAVVRSLESGMTPTRFFEFVEDLDVSVPLVCMTYYNLIYRYGDNSGPRPFVEKAADVGIEGFVVPDLPAEESDPLREACDEFGLDLVFIVAPTTRGERLERIMQQVSGYVYVQARLGTTGAQTSVSDQTDSSLARLSEYDVPKAVGFGISSGDHAERIVRSGADGIIVGSALVDIVAAGHEDGDDPGTVADRLETLARELKEGALSGASQRPPHSERT
ncbi:tryptophan synthase subunit alpha [Haloferax mediterranei ATCC 33500]|uniref:Tryptophan synthase alpha chain n=1 Tax=Haloferax mediterranei (strain ATCC 33500 / DSM 1411 / JCM 8866 / NBRC 14739 / NCIMB 2177 / R-4) TaxID=523841 RepID=I3R2L1_HALMT|nr:tryptophan synthase subunit alpha [Haloferax mediterranei]AFK18471.1 tryptophan synthase subunit alpha [Haloferax mediterranei ATCC 33500]EMA02255.1 tryptophan synthase subunit alpha [Haloferax mediterranei ATCC 33500]MDX5988562.1 tryptophan synthase subunit alpha [Haloferax mediterranei ATCC 33500]QCQ74975.1 tryptophan synthase subunit alpha [Haloferax mediterranei ATCC 33500]